MTRPTTEELRRRIEELEKWVIEPAIICDEVTDADSPPPSPFRLRNGQKVREIVTGFTGIITGRADYIAGCRQYCVQPVSPDGKYEEARWFDEERLEIVDADPVNVASTPTGGPGDRASAAPTR